MIREQESWDSLMAQEEKRDQGKEREEEEEEDEKMKDFYRLMERIRATRELWKAAAPTERPRKPETLLWKPAFEWEDFASKGSSEVRDDGMSSHQENLEHGKDCSLDLSLGL
ncbi:NRR repressor homolog 3-like [Phalaenopsis equestris]|uniref:NRR repressor homolog 3-like n=1 Tax=Phalaenopsis equestris TaxID=78828 RepID=UPI0009E1C69B|nr:NRR repressor homolog 3-like [Phalaenopsis equestris]